MAHITVFGQANHRCPRDTRRSAPPAPAISATSATLGATVDDDGGASIIARGIVFSLSSDNSDPALGGSGVTVLSSSGATGDFTVDAIGLQPGKTYPFAGYATNSAGTAYSSVSTFGTLAGVGTTSLFEPAAGGSDIVVSVGAWTASATPPGCIRATWVWQRPGKLHG